MDGLLVKPARALIVEDDPRVAALHRAFLEEEGLKVGGISGTLREAWAFLEENPDLVLLDLYLPDGHGLELLPALEGVYTVVITAAKDVPTVERALLGGAMDYLVKPFGRSQLREALVLRNASEPPRPASIHADRRRAGRQPAPIPSELPPLLPTFFHPTRPRFCSSRERTA